MRPKQLSVMIIFLTLLTGCLSTSQNYYVLSMADEPVKHFRLHSGVIGVEKVKVPGYLYKREIAIAESPHKITLLKDAVWGEDLDSGLTQRLIGFLQKKFKHPEVYAYPWGTDRKPDIKLSVQISRFIAQGGYVYLDVTWHLEHLSTKKREANLFSTKVQTDSSVQSIVEAMHTAFAQFEADVAKGLVAF